MPIDENGINRNQPNLSSHTECGKQCRFTEAYNREVNGATGFQKTGLLKMADYKCVVTFTLCLQCIPDGLCGTAKLR